LEPLGKVWVVGVVGVVRIIVIGHGLEVSCSALSSHVQSGGESL